MTLPRPTSLIERKVSVVKTYAKGGNEGCSRREIVRGVERISGDIGVAVFRIVAVVRISVEQVVAIAAVPEIENNIV